jgi:transposase
VVIDIMTRLKVHLLLETGLPLPDIAALAGVGQRSVERIEKEDPPTAEEIAAGKKLCGETRGRPSKVAQFEAKVVGLLTAEPKLPGTEVLRLMEKEGYDGGRSAMLDLVKRVRPPLPAEPVIRFEGLPGEFTQWDFGEAMLTFATGERHKVEFFCGRLKYSRYMHVVIVPNHQAEALIRALVACLVVFGGSTKQWVFDNAKTIRVSRMSEPLVLHSYLRDLVAEMNVLPEMCAPRSGNQKGSVESLVKFVKRSFLFVRKFADMADLRVQLAEWLREVNHVRPCDATSRIPEELRQEELRWLQKRPVRWDAESYPLRETRTVSVMATVPFAGTPYSAPPKRVGAPVTLLIREHHIDMYLDGEPVWRHQRRDHQGTVQRLPEHRREMLEVVHGQRKHNYFKRQCLLELGRPALDFLEQLIHLHEGGSWAPEVDRLFDLLLCHGEDKLRQAMAACNASGAYNARAVSVALRRAA